MTYPTRALGMQWSPARPRVLVVACSDGRLQEATDAFLASALGNDPHESALRRELALIILSRVS